MWYDFKCLVISIALVANCQNVICLVGMDAAMLQILSIVEIAGKTVLIFRLRCGRKTNKCISLLTNLKSLRILNHNAPILWRRQKRFGDFRPLWFEALCLSFVFLLRQIS